VSDPANRDDEFTVEELNMARWIFGALYAASLLLILGVIMLTALAGYWGWPWFAVLPVAAALVFGSRVIRRFFRNLFDGVGEQLGEKKPVPARARGARFRPTGVLAVLLVVLIMIGVAALWYGVGVIVRLLIHG